MNRRMSVLAMAAVMLFSGCKGGGNPTAPGPTGPPAPTTVTLRNIEYVRAVINSPDLMDAEPVMSFGWYGKGAADKQPIVCRLVKMSDTLFVCPEMTNVPFHFECGKTGQADPHKVYVSDPARVKRDAAGIPIPGTSVVATDLTIYNTRVRVHIEEPPREMGIFTIDACNNVR